MTIHGLPAGMDWYTWWTVWLGGRLGGGGQGALVNLGARAQVLTNLVPPSVMQHLGTFERSRLVLLVEKIGEYGTTAAQRALTAGERQSMVRISHGINRIVGAARTAAAQQATLSRAAQQQMQWVRNVNLRRAAPRGILGTLGLGGTVVLTGVAAVILVGVLANARLTAKIEEIQALNAAGVPPQEIVYGTAPNDCVQDEAAARGLVWTAPDGSECFGESDCSWRAPVDLPEPIWSDFEGRELEARRSQYIRDLAWFAAPRLAAARVECGLDDPNTSIAEGPIPSAEELCTFLPPGMVRLAQPPLGDPGRVTDCVMRDPGTEGVKMWAEVLAFNGQSGASIWLGGVEFAINGSPEQLGIGDQSWLIKSTSPTNRHVLGGRIGPVGFALYACEECAGTLIGDLESTARHIGDAYEKWAEQQG